jgi:hypothetical protein
MDVIVEARRAFSGKNFRIQFKSCGINYRIGKTQNKRIFLSSLMGSERDPPDQGDLQNSHSQRS